MDARELTDKYHKMSADISEIKKQVEYLTLEVKKQRMLLDDLKIDIKMLGGKR